MAKVIKELAPHALRKYPWADWLDGRVWELTAGKDFDVTVESFRSTAIGKARDLGGKLRTRVVTHGTRRMLQIQFYEEEE